MQNKRFDRSHLGQGMTLAIALTLAMSVGGVASAVTDHNLGIAGLPKSWAQTAHQAAHRDNRNSDSVPYVGAPHYERSYFLFGPEGFRLGTLSVYAPTELPGPPGSDFVICGTIAAKEGQSALNCFHQLTGETAWQTQPWTGPDDESTLDSRAGGGQPTVDPQGNLYTADFNQIWSYTSTGEVRWVFDYRATGIALFGNSTDLSFGWTPMLNPDGTLLLYLDSDARVWALDPLSGELKGVHEIPPGPVPECGPVARNVLGVGMSSRFAGEGLGCVGIGAVQQSNTQAMLSQFVQQTETSKTSRVFGAVLGLVETEGRLVAVDVTQDAEGNVTLGEAWTATINGFSGTSPTIIEDESIITLVDNTLTLIGISTATGEEVWTNPGAEALFSPSTDDNVILSGDRTSLSAFDGHTGERIWQTEYSSIATANWPVAPVIPFVVPDGTPQAGLFTFTNGTGDGTAWLNLTIGYFTAPVGQLGSSMLAKQETLVQIDLATGELVPGSQAVWQGTAEAGRVPNRAGAMISGQFDNVSSVAWWFINPFIPRVLDGLRPQGGYSVAEASSYTDWLENSLKQIIEWNQGALGSLGGGPEALQTAFDMSRKSEMQLTIVPNQLVGAVERRQELTQEQANGLGASLAVALAQQAQATQLILNNGVEPVPPESVSQAQQLISNSTERAVTALSTLIQVGLGIN